MSTFTAPARHRAPDNEHPSPPGRPGTTPRGFAFAGRRTATSVAVTGLVVSMFGAPATATPAAADSTERLAHAGEPGARSLRYLPSRVSAPIGARWSFDLPALTTVPDPAPAQPEANPGALRAEAGAADGEALDAGVLAAADDAALTAAVAEAAAQDSVAAQGATAAAGTRQAALQPFSVTAPANTSFGSGAKFESAGSTKTAALLKGNPNLNAEKWSIAVAIARSTDPVAKVTNITKGTVTNFRVPSGAQVTAGTDKHMTVVQPDGYTAYECYKMTKVGTNSWTTTYMVKTDLRTNGLAAGARASGISQIMGLIRVAEVKAKKIPHTLAIGIPDSMLKSGQVWPARLQDSNASTAYKGPIPMGTMMGIPPSVDLSRLGLTPEGLALGKALQDYGAHVLVRASTVALFAEPASDAAAVYRMRADWKAKLYPLMRVVTNNTPSTVGGGGVRRQPAAAALAQ